MENYAGLSLRERKKLITRKAIVDAAQAMFGERGFDNVTVAEIADAVNISAKTVFVYFPTKEDLVFAGEDEVRDQILARVRDRPVGSTALDAMRALLVDELSASGSHSVAGLDELYTMIGDSYPLQARMRLMWERFEEALAAELAAETGVDAHEPAPRVAAAQLISLYRLMASHEVRSYIRSHPKTRQRAAFSHWLDVSAAMVADGIADYARRDA